MGSGEAVFRQASKDAPFGFRLLSDCSLLVARGSPATAADQARQSTRNP
jgi:hypothetical protein